MQGQAPAAAGADVGPTSIALAAVERVAAMSLEEVQQLLARGGRRTVVVPGAGEGAPPLLRRAKDKVVIPGPKDKGGRVYTLGELLARAALAPAALALAFLVWWRPHALALGGGAAFGLLAGMAFAWLYVRNVKAKEQTQQLVRTRAWGVCM